MLHLLYAHTTVRGENTEVIEDTVPLYDVKCSVKYSKKPRRHPTGCPLGLYLTDQGLAAYRNLK